MGIRFERDHPAMRADPGGKGQRVVAHVRARVPDGAAGQLFVADRIVEERLEPPLPHLLLPDRGPGPEQHFRPPQRSGAHSQPPGLRGPVPDHGDTLGPAFRRRRLT